METETVVISTKEYNELQALKRQPDTVVLSIKDYDSLINFRKKIKEGNIFTTTLFTKNIKDKWTIFSNPFSNVFTQSTIESFYTKDAIIEKLVSDNNELIKKNNEINKELFDIKRNFEEIKSHKDKCDTIVEAIKLKFSGIKNMSVREFRKWKKENNNE